MVTWTGNRLGRFGVSPSYPSGCIAKRFWLSPFYSKCIVLEGFPIVSSSRVSDTALSEAAWDCLEDAREPTGCFATVGEEQDSVVGHVGRRTYLRYPEHSDLLQLRTGINAHEDWGQRVRAPAYPARKRICYITLGTLMRRSRSSFTNSRTRFT